MRVAAYLAQGLERYVQQGTATGGFLRQVLENDFAKAMLHAGVAITIDDLKGLAIWLMNDAPPECWGSPEHVAAWIKRGGLQGRDSQADGHAEPTSGDEPDFEVGGSG